MNPSVNLSDPTARRRRTRGAHRRGNTLVLVAGILVLLVIVATAYITRTQSQRVVSVATSASRQIDDNSDLIGVKVAEEIAAALFTWPVDPDDPMLAYNFTTEIAHGVADANFPRRPPAQDASRYAPDPIAPYNRAPYHTVPWTNLPDPGAIADYINDTNLNPSVQLWPAGTGNPGIDAGTAGNGTVPNTPNGQVAAAAAVLSTESNPLGNPGTGDNRWLADTEPLRWDTSAFNSLIGFLPARLDAFSHWRKMTNLARANNAIRVIGDIADVEGTIVTNLNLPIEQWPIRLPRLSNLLFTSQPQPFNLATGNVNFGQVGVDRFREQWKAWFGLDPNTPPYISHEDARLNIAQSPGTPPNLYKLNDLNGNGEIHDYVIPVNGEPVAQDRPESEFIEGTARNLVSRVLADADGDGFTDSFWFTAPTPVRGGVRQIMAARIVDNSALLNANIATRFFRNNTDFNAPGGFRMKTRGLNPADLALVGQLALIPPPGGQGPNNPYSGEGANFWTAGFYDNPGNWSHTNEYYVDVGDAIGGQRLAYNRNRWWRHLSEIGLPHNPSNNPVQNNLLAEIDRLDYWQFAGRHGIDSYLPATNYTPFGLSDELELRMYHGNNNPKVYTRFEWSVQSDDEDSLERFLRAGSDRIESSEYSSQLNNRDLLRDNRRKLTLHSGARNDELPPWLRWNERFEYFPRIIESQLTGAFDASGTPFGAERFERIRRQFLGQARRKLDLREQEVIFESFDLTIPPSQAFGLAPKMYEYDIDTPGFPDYRKPLYPAWDATDPERVGRLNMRERLASTLMLALSDVVDEFIQPHFENFAYGTYYGPYTTRPSTGLDDLDGIPVHRLNDSDNPFDWTRRLAAGYAANILAYRSRQPVRLVDRVLLPEVRLSDDQFYPPGQENWVDVNGWSGVSTSPKGHVALDPQPFLVEAFIAHVYSPSETVPPWHVPDADDLGVICDQLDPANPPPYEGVEPYNDYDSTSPRGIIFDRGATDPFRSTIIVVQIANPFDVPIDLSEYRIEVFGQPYDLSQMTTTSPNKRYLQPATNSRPTSAIFYAMEEAIPGEAGDDVLRDDDKWLAFLDVVVADATRPVQENDGLDLAPGTIVHHVDGAWDTDTRESYDNRDALGDPIHVNPDANTIVLRRRDESLSGVGTPDWVLIDRFDPREGDRDFAEAVNGMYEYRPRNAVIPVCEAPPDINGDYPSYTVEPGEHWVQWVRATRAWGVELNGNFTTNSDDEIVSLYEPHERCPRFVFGDRAVIVPTENGTPQNAGGDSTFVQARDRSDGEPESQTNGNEPGANVYTFADNPNGAPGTVDPWFARSYYDSLGVLRDFDPAGGTPPTGRGTWRKPTFFSLGYRHDLNPGETDEELRPFFMPDKGWYGQYRLFAQLGQALDELNAQFVLSSPDLLRLNGVGTVDYPPILTEDTEFVFPNVSNTIPPGTPPQLLIRAPFAMQMSLKNKHLAQDYVNGELDPGIDPTISLRRNKDFEQVGELLNVWLFGHELEMDITGPADFPTTEDYVETLTTFSEFMSEQNWRLTGAMPPGFDGPEDYNTWVERAQPHLVNRLRLTPIRIFPDAPTSDPDDYIVIGDVIGRPRPIAVPVSPDTDGFALTDVRHSMPNLPAGVRVLDAFVCDGPGRMLVDEDNDGFINQFDVELLSLFNANGFAGRLTPGLININTAMPEVLAALPHMSKLVHETYTPLSELPVTSLPWAIQRYRERIGTPVWEVVPGSTIPPLHFGAPSWGAGSNPAQKVDLGPAYAHRGRPSDIIDAFGNTSTPFFTPGDGVFGFIPGLRGERGFASIGELGLLTQSGRFDKDAATLSPDFVYNPLNAAGAFTAIDLNSSWRIDYPAMPERFTHLLDDPYLYGETNENPLAYLFSEVPESPIDSDAPRVSLSARLGTDVVEVFDEDEFVNGVGSLGGYSNGFYPDLVAEDAREANLLLAGISNLVTTRSDVFTVYLRVRTFRQNPVTGVWDATDPNYIIDDSRYVMLVDRSEVNRPTDKPKILYLEKAP